MRSPTSYNGELLTWAVIILDTFEHGRGQVVFGRSPEKFQSNLLDLRKVSELSVSPRIWQNIIAFRDCVARPHSRIRLSSLSAMWKFSNFVETISVNSKNSRRLICDMLSNYCKEFV